MKRALLSATLMFCSTSAWADDATKPDAKPDATAEPVAESPEATTPPTKDAPPDTTAASGDAEPAAPADPAKAAPTSGNDCQVAVMNFQPKGLPDSQKHVPELLADSLAAEVASSTGCRVVTQADITQMLDFEATKASCGAMTESCLAEVGGALGVDRIIGGSVGKLGESFKLQIKLQNVAEARVEKRVDRLIRGEPEALDLAARNAGRELFGLELLDESKYAVQEEAPAEEGGSVLPAVLMGTGGAILAVGAIAVVATGVYVAVANFVLIPKNDIVSLPTDQRSLAQVAAWGALAGSGVASVVAIVGGGVLVTGLLVE